MDLDPTDLLDEFCDWMDTIDDETGLICPPWRIHARRMLEDAVEFDHRLERLGQSQLLCKFMHVYDEQAHLHRYVVCAFVGEEWGNMELQYMISPLVVTATWIVGSSARPCASDAIVASLHHISSFSPLSKRTLCRERPLADGVKLYRIVFGTKVSCVLWVLSDHLTTYNVDNAAIDYYGEIQFIGIHVLCALRAFTAAASRAPALLTARDSRTVCAENCGHGHVLSTSARNVVSATSFRMRRRLVPCECSQCEGVRQVTSSERQKHLERDELARLVVAKVESEPAVTPSELVSSTSVTGLNQSDYAQDVDMATSDRLPRGSTPHPHYGMATPSVTEEPASNPVAEELWEHSVPPSTSSNSVLSPNTDPLSGYTIDDNWEDHVGDGAGFEDTVTVPTPSDRPCPDIPLLSSAGEPAVQNTVNLNRRLSPCSALPDVSAISSPLGVPAAKHNENTLDPFFQPTQPTSSFSVGGVHPQRGIVMLSTSHFEPAMCSSSSLASSSSLSAS
ncbi:hypothetical protein BV25DRAFT_1839795 [Artomyces pyxidatus]|uniref:Uncharacterized protein n=1 Tax=Artomyces pyxidatus TaxID=48021 RepID=A0ACB8SVQ6_9AGAM|nr:hypothetical protein BV25DRAFT_1839795 [Artomyces pyxidatus]